MIQLGSNTIKNFYLGSNQVKSIWLGSNKVWPNYPPYSISWLPSTYDITTITSSSTPTFSISGSWTSSQYSSAYNGVQYKSNKISDNGSTIFQITFSNVTSITFSCRSYGESNYDYMTIGNLDSTCSRTSYKTSLKGVSGPTTYTDVTFTTDGGTHYVQFCYSKDGSVSSNDDDCYVYIKSVTAKSSTVTTTYNNYATVYNDSTTLTTISSPITSSNWNSSANNIRFDTHTTSAIIYSQISNLTNTSSMFYNCSSLTSVDFSSWNSNSVTSYSNMFYNCNSLSTIVMNGCDDTTIEFIKSRISDASIAHDIKLTNSDLYYYCQWSGTSKTWSQIITDYSKIPLCIENNTSTVGTVTLTLNGSGVSVKLSTSTDNINWTTETTYSATSTFTLPASGKLYLKGSNTQFNSNNSNYYSISANVSHNIYGNIMSLCNYKTTLSKYEFYGLFKNDKNLISTKNLILPATTIAIYCYSNMFYSCTSLTTAPVLPATTLADACYGNMFSNCTSLTTAPALPATTLADSYCYVSMFSGCTSLTSAPELPATTLTTNCYCQMFYGCTKLNYIKAMFTTTPSTTYTNNWVTNVASSGTFIKNAAATWDVTGVNGVPSGWTVQTATS